jgi:hypothetical protein
MTAIAIPLEVLREDVSAPMLAKRLGCCSSVIKRRRKALGIERPKYVPRRVTPTMEDFQTLTVGEMARKYDCGTDVIYRRRVEMGLGRLERIGPRRIERTPRERAIFTAMLWLVEKAVKAGATVDQALEAFHEDGRQIMRHVTYFGDTVRIRGRMGWA